MMGFGGLAALLALIILLRMRRGRGIPTGKWFLPAMWAMPFLPVIGIAFGWIFTESARQPWIVFGLFKTSQAVSPSVSAGNVLFTMVTFTLLYGVLAVIEFGLMFRTIKVGPEPTTKLESTDSDSVLTMAY
jgi:cytochrome d ubiquinol oxidase subunit I